MSYRKLKRLEKRWAFFEGVAYGITFAALMMGMVIFMLAW